MNPTDSYILYGYNMPAQILSMQHMLQNVSYNMKHHLCILVNTSVGCQAHLWLLPRAI